MRYNISYNPIFFQTSFVGNIETPEIFIFVENSVFGKIRKSQCCFNNFANSANDKFSFMDF